MPCCARKPTRFYRAICKVGRFKPITSITFYSWGVRLFSKGSTSPISVLYSILSPFYPRLQHQGLSKANIRSRLQHELKLSLYIQVPNFVDGILSSCRHQGPRVHVRHLSAREPQQVLLAFGFGNRRSVFSGVRCGMCNALFFVALPDDF